MAATTTGEQASATRVGARATARRAVLLLVAANVLWAGTYTAGKIALRELSPVELNALRFSLAALILSPALMRGWRTHPARPRDADHAGAARAAGLGAE